MIEASSPISNQSLEIAAERVAKVWRITRKRAPRAVNKRVRLALEHVFKEVQAEETDVVGRIRVARELESLWAELRGFQNFVPQFYSDGRLAVVRAWDPIKIKGAVDRGAVEAHFIRYLERTEKNFERLHYFYKRCGLEVEIKGKLKPWQRAYSSMDSFRELLWGRVGNDPMPGKKKTR